MKSINIPFFSPKKAKSRVGLDIGTSAVKVFALSPQKTGSPQVVFFSIRPIEGERSKETIIDAVKKAVTSVDVKIRNVTISVCGQSVVVRQALFPKMSDNELKSALQFEAEKFIPFNVNDVYMDAQVIDRNVEGNKMKVIIVASKKELVDEYLSYVNGAGLEADTIDCDSIAVANAFIFNNPGLGKEKTIALLNIGATMSNVCILKDEVLNFTRDIPVDVKDVDTLENQIRLSFDYYENQFGKGISGIYVSGGGAKEETLLQRFTQAFGIEVAVWDPTKNLSVAANLNAETLKQVSGQMAVCVGLTIRR